MVDRNTKATEVHFQIYSASGGKSTSIAPLWPRRIKRKNEWRMGGRIAGISKISIWTRHIIYSTNQEQVNHIKNGAMGKLIIRKLTLI
jgi:hypothetical protein